MAYRSVHGIYSLQILSVDSYFFFIGGAQLSLFLPVKKIEAMKRARELKIGPCLGLCTTFSYIQWYLR